MDIAELQRARPEVDYPIDGHVAPGWEAVADAFAGNFSPEAEEYEIGAAVAVLHRGEVVIDLWGGYTDAELSRPWQSDTLVGMMSVGKGIGAMVVHKLVDQGLLDLDAPVASYWPEFAAEGKDVVLLRHVLDHRSGVPYVDGLWRGAIYDHEAMARGIAAQKPGLKPTVEAGYHILTYGFILSEVVRRVTGQPIGAILREELSGPLGEEYYFGLTDAEIARTADLIVGQEGTILDTSIIPPGSLLSRVWDQQPEGITFNEPEFRKAEIVSGNGHGTPRAVARLFNAFMTGRIGDDRWLSEETIARATEVQHELVEQVNMRAYRQALGFVLESPPILYFAGHPLAYGHHGVGGAVGFADPAHELAFGYAPNRMHHHRVDNGPRAGSLIDACYAVLERA